MAIKLEKGQRINLEKGSGAKLTNFCVGCNWGAITKKAFFGMTTTTVDVDLDLSCLLFNEKGEVVDHIWSPLYNLGKIGLPQGKLDSNDRALHHTGDDLTGDQDGDDGLDNEIITVDLARVSSNVNSIVFFLNIYNNNDYQGDFSGIPYASIRMYEGTPTKVKEVFAQYDVATKTDCVGKRALVMGKLYRRNGEWKFAAIGDAFEDRSIALTIARVAKDYNK
ncbi:stress protein [Xylanibacter ruminicola]|uniref:Tellurium resistance protein n=2 Tax=Xylanibacter ruminicola TaxID=839 RepID=D5EUI7_XYLR2|nr:TerD family protein [Xylanibacter ruminicola]ADE83649.1 putative tellurium resistance protein [Xylanibacter ruminicola 23]GJG34438.1 stress protein [Xylanibacter ruminicola]SEH59220.1 tellurium resistance protein TerZ [Xylanibacter ruminicola]